MFLLAKTLINIYNTFLQAIPRGELHPCIEGKRQENLSKNKYTTIFPCRCTLEDNLTKSVTILFYIKAHLIS